MHLRVPARLGKMLQHPPLGWRPIESAAFGLINGAIIVLSLLMALGSQAEAPIRSAIVLFGSAAAMTLARILAELFSRSIATGEPILTLQSLGLAWQFSYPMLAVVKVPILLLLAAGSEWLPTGLAITLSQGYCIAILVILGARVGWVISHNPWHPLLGAASAGGIGVALAAMNHAIQ